MHRPLRKLELKALGSPADLRIGRAKRARKVRRRFIAEKYATLVDALYDGSPSVHIQAQVRYEDGRTGSVSADLRIADARTFPPAAARRAA